MEEGIRRMSRLGLGVRKGFLEESICQLRSSGNEDLVK